jgi:hypothetical protein
MYTIIEYVGYEGAEIKGYYRTLEAAIKEFDELTKSGELFGQKLVFNIGEGETLMIATTDFIGIYLNYITPEEDKNGNSSI